MQLGSCRFMRMASHYAVAPELPSHHLRWFEHFRPEVGGGRGGDMRLINTTHARPTTFRPFSTMIEHGWWSLSGLTDISVKVHGRLVRWYNCARALQLASKANASAATTARPTCTTPRGSTKVCSAPWEDDDADDADDAGDAGEPTIPTILNGLETTDSSALRTTCRFEQPSSEPPHLPSSQTSRDSSL